MQPKTNAMRKKKINRKRTCDTLQSIGRDNERERVRERGTEGERERGKESQ